MSRQEIVKNSNSKNPTPYPELNEVLALLVTSTQKVLEDNFIGFYLQGSFAVGDFDYLFIIGLCHHKEQDLCIIL